MTRRAAIPFVALVLAVAAAVVWDLVRTPTYAARTTLLVSSALTKRGTALQTELETFRELARTPIVAQNVVRSLDTGGSADALLRRTSVSIDSKAALLRLTVEDSSPTKAVQLCQQYAAAFLAIAAARLGASSRVQVWQPARSVGRVSPRPVRDAALAGAGGLLVGLVLLLRGRRPVRRDPRRPAPESPRAVGQATEALGPQVAEVVRRAIELGERERELEARGRELERAAVAAGSLRAEPRPEPAPKPAPESPAISAPEPHLDSPPAGPPSRWTVSELERRVGAARSVFPERIEEWEVYLDQLRAVSGESGAIPPQFEGLVWEVFDPLV